MNIPKIEKEYKMLLSKDEFDSLLNTYKPNKILKQTNYYFDSKPSLYSRGFSIRIREIDNKYTFTLKESTSLGKLEHEFDIDSFNIDDIVIKKLLDELNIHEPLSNIGSLKTTRHLFIDEFGELCIDYNEYNNIIDYEVEYELFDYTLDKLDHFKNILKKCNIEYKENPLSKLRRFISSL